MRYMGSQKSSHIKPNAPVRINAHCHPHVMKIQGTVSGATIAPTLVPALKIPVVRARSFFGNHSATVFIAAGKFAASPTPSAALAKPNPMGVRASAAEEDVAIRASRVLGLGIAGVDLIRSQRGPLVLEVNASPGLEGIEDASGVDVAGEIVTYLAERVRRKAVKRASAR